jgi:hypothetical protein
MFRGEPSRETRETSSRIEVCYRASIIRLTGVSEDLIGALPVRTVTKHIGEQRDAATSSAAGTPSDAPK